MNIYIPNPKIRLQFAFAQIATMFAYLLSMTFINSQLSKLSSTFDALEYWTLFIPGTFLIILSFEATRQTYFKGKTWAIKVIPWCCWTAFLPILRIEEEMGTDFRFWGLLGFCLFDLLMWGASYVLLKKLHAASPARALLPKS